MHLNQRRKLTATPEQWAAWDKAAKAAGVPWSVWCAQLLEALMFTNNAHAVKALETVVRRLKSGAIGFRHGQIQSTIVRVCRELDGDFDFPK